MPKTKTQDDPIVTITCTASQARTILANTYGADAAVLAKPTKEKPLYAQVRERVKAAKKAKAVKKPIAKPAKPSSKKPTIDAVLAYLRAHGPTSLAALSAKLRADPKSIGGAVGSFNRWGNGPKIAIEKTNEGNVLSVGSKRGKAKKTRAKPAKKTKAKAKAKKKPAPAAPPVVEMKPETEKTSEAAPVVTPVEVAAPLATEPPPPFEATFAGEGS